MYLSELFLIAVAEFLVVFSIIAVVFFFAMQEKIKQLKMALKSQKEKQLAGEKNRAAMPQPPCSALLFENDSDLIKELELARKKIVNLEKFKSLYFSSEPVIEAANRALSMVSGLDSRFNEQRLKISRLVELLSKEKKKLLTEHEYSEELEGVIVGLEALQAGMSKEVRQAKVSIENTDLLIKEMNGIRERANVLAKENSAQYIDIINYKKMVAQLKLQSAGYDSDQLAKVDELLLVLSKKDKEIEQLKNECDVLGTQYHQLAVQSLDDQRQSFDDNEVDNILADLAKSAKQLVKCKLDCQNLENGFDGVSAQDIDQYQLQIDAAIGRKTDAENDYRALSSKVEAVVGADRRAELMRIKGEINKKTYEAQIYIKEHVKSVTGE